MAITVKNLNAFAKNTSLTQTQMRTLYDYLVEKQGKDNVDIDILAMHVKSCTGFNSVDEYIATVDAPTDREPTLSKEQIQEQVHKQMNDRVSANERIKRGYSKRQWAQIQRFEEVMKINVRNLVTNFMSEMVIQGIKEDDEAAVTLFDKYEGIWKDFCRKEIINRYPGSDRSSGDIRTNIMGLFAKMTHSVISNRKVQEQQDVITGV